MRPDLSLELRGQVRWPVEGVIPSHINVAGRRQTRFHKRRSGIQVLFRKSGGSNVEIALFVLEYGGNNGVESRDWGRQSVQVHFSRANARPTRFIAQESGFHRHHVRKAHAHPCFRIFRLPYLELLFAILLSELFRYQWPIHHSFSCPSTLRQQMLELGLREVEEGVR